MRTDAQSVTDRESYKAGEHLFEAARGSARARMDQMGGSTVEMIGGGIITVVVVAIVLNQLFTLSIVNQTSGPFSGILQSTENIGGAALTLVVVGFLAAGAAVTLSMFRGRF
jgi:hypothetical protein